MTATHGFTVEVLEFDEIHTLPGSWTSERYREILDRLDFDNIDSIAESDLAEMAAMAAQDEGLRNASDQVLSLVFGNSMSPGVRQNLIDDLPGERPWELFAELSQQAGIFEAVEFLQRAFPSEFGIPDAARIRVRVTGRGKQATDWLREGPNASLLLRLLADAMDDRSTLRRLYADKLQSPPFPEADSIVWHVAKIDDRVEDSPAFCVFEVYSSLQWLGPLRDADGETLSDAEPDDSA